MKDVSYANMIWHKGQSYIVSDEAIDKLSAFGPDIASGQVNEDEAVAAVLRGDGFTL